jgi:hypothetical protein
MSNMPTTHNSLTPYVEDEDVHDTGPDTNSAAQETLSKSAEVQDKH